MKVVQINTVYYHGGSTGRIVYDLHNISNNSGIDAYVIYGYDYSKSNFDKTYKTESIIELKVNILKTRLFAHHGFYNSIETKRIIHLLDEIEPDIIHLHNLHNHYLNVKMLFDYLKIKKIPVVWTLHDCWSFTGWCAHFDYIGCNKWKTHCHNCPNKKDYPFTWFFDRSYRNYNDKKQCFNGVENMTIVTPSEWLKRLVEQSYLSCYPTRVIRNGIDLSVFKPSDSEFRQQNGINEKRIILFVAMNSSKLKGIDYVIQLADLIDKEKEVIVVVGANDSLFENYPTGIIPFRRTNSPTELAKIYSAADVLINPTLQDNYPTTNLEAIACGTPVITFNTGGSPESIYEGCGKVVYKRSADDLYIAIKQLWETGVDKEQLVCIAKTYFDKNRCFMEYIDLYKSIARCVR